MSKGVWEQYGLEQSQNEKKSIKYSLFIKVELNIKKLMITSTHRKVYKTPVDRIVVYN